MGVGGRLLVAQILERPFSVVSEPMLQLKVQFAAFFNTSKIGTLSAPLQTQNVQCFVALLNVRMISLEFAKCH